MSARPRSTTSFSCHRERCTIVVSADQPSRARWFVVPKTAGDITDHRSSGQRQHARRPRQRLELPRYPGASCCRSSACSGGHEHVAGVAGVKRPCRPSTRVSGATAWTAAPTSGRRSDVTVPAGRCGCGRSVLLRDVDDVARRVGEPMRSSAPSAVDASVVGCQGSRTVLG